MIRTGRDLLRAALGRFVDGGGFLVGEAVGAHGVTAGIAKNLVRTPLSESAALGVAAGLALGGKRVVVELVDPAGLARAADVLADLAGLEARSGGAFSAPIVVRAPALGAGGQPPATPPAPGARILVAATADDVVGLLEAALASGKPTVILESAAALDDVGAGGPCAPLGAAVVRREGAGATILAAGDAVAAALAADTGATVVDVRAVAPLDRATIAAQARATGRVVAVGVPGALDVVLADAFLTLESPPVVLPGDATSERIAAAVRDALTY
jgi:pyruvate dehydrogenase E1 component beta subunit